MQKQVNNKNFYRIMMILIFVVGLLIGSCGSYLLFFADRTIDNGADQSVFSEITSLINRHWLDTTESDTSTQSRMLGGMVGGLGDPYTSYMSAEEAQDFTNSINGDYQGIGVAYQLVGEGALVTKVFAESPASKAGVAIGDIIIGADGTSLKGKTSDEVKDLIRGKENTYVKLKIQRGTKTIEHNVKRAALDTDVFYDSRQNDDVMFGYIEINTFGTSTGSEVEEALKSFKAKEINTIVIDLRNNGGGYLNAASEILNLFCKKGETLFSLEDKDGNKVAYKDETDTQYTFDQGFILMNNETASASELFAGAMSELYSYKLVGTKSYGKGSAQTQATLSDSSVIKYTYALWYTPNGNNINKTGLSPDYEVKGNAIASLALDPVTGKYNYDDVDEAVKTMQMMLKELGYKVDRTDGYFSKKTESALKSFQEDQHIKVDGVYGKNSYQHLLGAMSIYLGEIENDPQYKKVLQLMK